MPVDNPGSPSWWETRVHRVQQRKRADPMSIGRIVSAAMALIDRQGLDGLSMRNLALELGSGTATIYRYVRSRDEILVEVVDAVLGGSPTTPPTVALEGWRAKVEWMTARLRSALLAHPNVVPLLTGSVPLGPNALRGREAMLSVLAGCFDSEQAVAAYLAIVHYVVGFVAAEATTSFVYDPVQIAALRQYYQRLPGTQFPHIVAMSDQLAQRDNDEEFRFGLSLLLDGMAARLNCDGADAQPRR